MHFISFQAHPYSTTHTFTLQHYSAHFNNRRFVCDHFEIQFIKH